MDAAQTIRVAVVMRRERLSSPWQSFAWRPVDVTMDGGEYGFEPRCLVDGSAEARWLYPDMELTLFRDEAENYYLNAIAPTPSAFVMWRMEEADGVPVAVPQAVTLSYGEAARWMDSAEQVEPVPLAPAMRVWLDTFVTAHYVPEQKKRRRPQSFITPAERG